MKAFLNSTIFVAAAAFGCALFAQELPQVDGTTGAPLGGIGTGAVKFCGNNGHLYFTEVAPVKCGNNGASYLDFAGQGSFFELYSNRGGTIATKTRMIATSTNGRYDDDAIYPIQKANFGAINGINVTLTGSCPWAPSDSNKMTYPCALFEFQVQNTQTTSADISIGFKLTYDNQPALVAAKGMRDETANSDQKAVYAKSDDAAAVITMGQDGTFLTNGQCNNQINGNTNMVAVKVTLAANQTKLVKFVFAWYNATQPDFYYYTNLFSAVGAVADSGLSDFDLFMTNATSMVTRMRGSNVPDWIVNTTQNALCLLTNNSRYFQDGRMLYAEGAFGTQGTMDQAWHARYIVSQLCPFYAWQELEWWARTQKTVDSAVGQIHHDLISDCGGPYAAWDQTDWADYQNINPWPGLNCGFIFGVFETFMATNNRVKLDWFWPYVLKAGLRILTQVKLYGNTTTYPYTFEQSSHSSYDWNGQGTTYLYNSSLTIPAYTVMAKLATIENDAADAARFQGAHDTAVTSFKKRFIDNIFTTANYCEAIGAGPWMTDFLKLGYDFDSSDINKLTNQLDTFYNPLVNGCGAFTADSNFGGNYFIWEPYLLTHYGDLALVTGKQNIWYAMRHDHFQRCYQDRDRVFNMFIPSYNEPTPQVPVSTNPTGHDMYITYMDFYREYHSIIGYQRDRNSGALWLEPNLPASMNDTLKNGFYIAPEGDGTISFTQNPVTFEQSILFKPDSAISVNQVYVKDKYGSTLPPVWVNGIQIPAANVTRIGIGYGKELKINWSGTVNPATGLAVEVTSTPTTGVARQMAEAGKLFTGIRDGKLLDIRYLVPNTCRVLISLFQVDGRKIADVVDEVQGAGSHNVTLAGKMIAAPAIYIVSITAGNKKTERKVMMVGR